MIKSTGILVGTKIVNNDEKIFLIQEQIENFKHALQDPSSWTHQLYESNTPKKDFIRKWGEALEELHNLGAYPDDLTTISSYIRKELKSMGLEKATDYARKSLPNKYKDPSMVHAESLFIHEYMDRGYQDRETVKSKEEIMAENKHYIKAYTDDAKLFLDFIKKLQVNEFESKLDPYESNEFLTRKKGMYKLLRNAMDGRDKVLPEQLHILMQAYSETTKSDAFAKYLQHVRKIIKITPKQAVKLLSGRVSKVELLYEPKSRMHARYAGFTGQICEECGSWRVDCKYNTDLNENMAFCYNCKEWSLLKTERLMAK